MPPLITRTSTVANTQSHVPQNISAKIETKTMKQFVLQSNLVRIKCDPLCSGHSVDYCMVRLLYVISY